MADETIVKSESGFKYRVKEGQKATQMSPLGTFIVTDKRIIFASCGAGGAKQLGGIITGRAIGGIGAGGLITHKLIFKEMSRVAPEEINKALADPDSFSILFNNLIEAKVEKMIGMKQLVLRWQTAQGQCGLLAHPQ